MSCQIIVMIVVCLQLTTSKSTIVIQQGPGQIVRAPGETAEMDCKLSTRLAYVYWYKELQNGSLLGIHQTYKSATNLPGKYSGKVNTATNTYSLKINNLQKNDSGVYYCGLAAYVYPNFGNGTRLIVTDASEPKLSILVPSISEHDELPHHVPLLCLLSDFTPSWSTVLWDTGDGLTEAQTDAGAIDGDGVFSVWSLTTIPAERWNQETICSCMAKENNMEKYINTTASKETGEAREGSCNYVLYWGLLCIFILVLILLLILLFRKYTTRARGAVQTGNQIPMRQIPQTEYAAVKYNK